MCSPSSCPSSSSFVSGAAALLQPSGQQQRWPTARTPKRKLASHAFLSRSLRRFTDGVLDVHLRRLFLPLLDDDAARDGGAIDLQDALRRFGFCAICHVAFGVESLSDVKPSKQVAVMAAALQATPLKTLAISRRRVGGELPVLRGG